MANEVSLRFTSGLKYFSDQVHGYGGRPKNYVASS